MAEGIPEFAVRLRCPEFPELENLDGGDLLERAHYRFLAHVDERGVCEWDYRCAHPAWSDRNLRDAARAVRASLFVAHIRAATDTPSQETNCHPFRHGRWLFVHVFHTRIGVNFWVDAILTATVGAVVLLLLIRLIRRA